MTKTFNSLLPRRFKRGLINGLGSLIKDLTGNLDNQDLIDVQGAIYEINKNQDSLNSQINEQVHINRQIIDRLDEIQQFASSNLQRLQKEINKTTQVTNALTLAILYDHHFYKINHVIDNLHLHFKETLDILSSSRTQTISRHLLTDDETEYIHNILKLDGINFQNANYMYNLLELKGFYNGTQLIFIINIPKFIKEIFYQYQVKIIPSSNKIIYPIQPISIILNPNQYQYITNTCHEIYDTIYCKLSKLESTQGSCIPAIISQLTASCKLQEISSYEEIDYIAYGKLYVQPKNRSIIYKSNCKQTTQKIIEQTLIEFRNCKITIEGEEYSTEEREERSNFEINLPYSDIKIEQIKPEMSMEILHNKSIQNIHAIELLHNKSKLHNSTGHISLILILIIIITIISFKAYKHRRNHITQVKNTPELQKQPDVNLRGEELCTLHSTPHNNNNINTVSI